MSVKITGLKEIKTKRDELLKRLAGETTRIVTRTRNATARDVLQKAKRARVVNSKLTREKLKDGKYLFPMGRDLVTMQRLEEGFVRTQKIPDKGLSFNYLRLKLERVPTKTKKKGGKPRRRYRISVIMGGQSRPYPGVFLIANQRWIPKPGKALFGAFKRTSEEPYPLEFVRGPSLAELMRTAGIEEPVIRKALTSWRAQLADRLPRVISRFQG